MVFAAVLARAHRRCRILRRFFSTTTAVARHKGAVRRTITVTEPNAGRRLDALVRRELVGVPLAAVMKWMRTGVIRVNGKKAKPQQRLVTGDEISMPDVSQPPPAAKPRKLDLVIVYEDDDILIVDKPALLAAHAGTGQADSLADRVIAYLQAENAAVGYKPGLAQRLDKGVSGLVPIGKHAKALRLLAEQVTQDRVRKVYRAIVTGNVSAASGEITVPLRIDDEPMGNRPRVHPDPNGLPAHTQYTRVEVLPHATVLDVGIHTGRTHQIRAHLRHLGHPLIGDPRYGNAQRDARATGGATRAIPERPAMHARALSLTHPTTGAPLSFEAPMPQDLERLLDVLRIAR